MIRDCRQTNTTAPYWLELSLSHLLSRRLFPTMFTLYVLDISRLPCILIVVSHIPLDWLLSLTLCKLRHNLVASVLLTPDL